MAKRITHLRAFLASPGDVTEERAIVCKVIERLNRQLARERRVAIDLVQWPDDVMPGIGSEPQAVISRQIGRCELFIVVLWKRLGMPTANHPSGTAEEFETAYTQWLADQGINILTYFSRRQFFPSEEDLIEMKRVFTFQRDLVGRGVLFAAYETIADFENKLERDLSKILLETHRGDEDGVERQVFSHIRSFRYLHRELAEMTEIATKVALLYIDMDQFTALRETLQKKYLKDGYDRGTDILRTIAATIFNVVGHRGNLYREGDEFAVVVANRDREHILEIAEEIRAAVESNGDHEGLQLTASIGVACSQDVSPFELYARAYDAVYVSKLTGKNRVTACPLDEIQVQLISSAHARGHS